MRSMSRSVYALILNFPLLVLAIGCTSEGTAVDDVNRPKSAVSASEDSTLASPDPVMSEPSPSENLAQSTENTVSTRERATPPS